MRAVCDDAAYLQHMLDFEAALARAEAAAGVIPASAAGPIAQACKAELVRSRRAGRGRDALRQSRDPAGQGADRRRRQGRRGGRALCALGRHQPGRDRYRHHADLARRHRRAAGRSRPRHRRLCQAGAQHRNTAVVARTWLQHALPMPFGLKLAEYAAALHRSRTRLQRLRSEALALQFGGAAGTLAALGDKGLRVAERLARGAQAAAAGCAVAHPSRPHRGGRLGVRDPRRHLRQDRPRCVADDADRCRRGVRAVGRRPRRLLDHAAQAQSRSRPRPRSPPPPWRPIWRRRFSPRRCRITSAAPGRGTRNGRPCRRCCWSPRARSPPSSTSPKGWKSMPRACASISTPPTG